MVGKLASYFKGGIDMLSEQRKDMFYELISESSNRELKKIQ